MVGVAQQIHIKTLSTILNSCPLPSLSLSLSISKSATFQREKHKDALKNLVLQLGFSQIFTFNFLCVFLV
ncbi:hypothetical protein RJT34_29465 [Clitoria ternatea]|uniref:Uncharacterized protein n=1 Tax=Clitoria ternatea TaxID=43366 RepID=A0AAN9I9N5_CLITE